MTDDIFVKFPRKPPPPFIYAPLRAALSIVFQDDDMLVLSKPSGLLSVPGRLAEHKDCLESRVKDEYQTARIIHRLDMETSGLIVMAMNEHAHRHIGLQFEKRRTSKTYIARVWGELDEDVGHVDLPLICDWPNRPLQKIDLTRGKQAQTDWRILEREGTQFTRVALTPITGRTHQLRVHMAEIGHPIVGDDFYAHEDAFRAAPRLHLHAHKLSLYHPKDERLMCFESPCPF